MKNFKTIVLAAGKGTRMKSDVPKVLHKVCGEPMIKYVLEIVKSLGSLKTFVVVGHKAQQVVDFIGTDFFSVEQKDQKGTAHAVRCVESMLKDFDGTVLILCGDTPLLKKVTIRKLISSHQKKKLDCTILTALIDDPTGYGRIFRSEDRQINAIVEHNDASSDLKKINEINVGVYCFNAKKLFSHLKDIKMNLKKKEYYFTDIIKIFSDLNYKIGTICAEDLEEGFGINSKHDLAFADKVLRMRIIKDFLDKGITIVDPDNTYIENNVTIGQDTIIKPYTCIEKGVKIGKNCVVGPFARLRCNTKIGNNVDIGNFAEINSSSVGDRTFMKHFSYLGNAFVGKDVNIGAGTITANFDGINKNNTVIEDGAFIGSDSVLIAPVRIGKKAVTAAGSVVTRGKNVKAGQIVMGVPAKLVSRRKV